MDNKNKKINILEDKTRLSPIIFNPNGQMKKEVRSKLINFSNNFYDNYDIENIDRETMIKDIWLIGQLASYDYNELYSNIDLQIIIDYKLIDNNKNIIENDIEQYENHYNKEHNDIIEDIEVEYHFQDIKDKIFSNGIYSVLRATWIKKPEKKKGKINKNKINNIIANVEKKIKRILSLYNDGDYKKSKILSSSLTSYINDLRKNGIINETQFNSDYAAYKSLKRLNLIKKVNEINKKANEKSILKNKENDNKLKPKNNKNKNIEIKTNKKKKNKEGYDDNINYNIMGKVYTSLRQAEKETGIPKSTLEYRVNQKNTKWSSYKKIK